MTEISREYAEALFELAAGSGSTAAVSDGLHFILKLFEDYPEYFAFLTSPGISKKERLDSLDSVLSGEVPDELVSFMLYMCSRGKLKYFNGAASEYEKLYSDSKSIVTVSVTSAVRLTDDEKQKLKEKLEKRYGKTVMLTYSVDRSLIGGIKLESNGFIIDGSIKHRLQDLKEVIDK